MLTKKITNCKNCNHPVDDKYCPKCGQLGELERIDSNYISQQIKLLFNIEKRFFYTTKEVFIRPGDAIHEFLFEDRNKYVKPIAFLIFTSIVFSLLAYFLGIEYSYLNVDKILWIQNKVNVGDLGNWMNNNIGYTNLILGCFIALWTKIFVRKRDYNIYEIIVLLCYILGETTLILTLTFVLGEITNSGLIISGLMFIFLLYPIWAIGQFLGKKKIISYVTSIAVIILGNVSYLLIFILIGYVNQIIQN